MTQKEPNSLVLGGNRGGGNGRKEGAGKLLSMGSDWDCKKGWRMEEEEGMSRLNEGKKLKWEKGWGWRKGRLRRNRRK